MPYSQKLRLDRICFDNINCDKRCNDLESYLLKKVTVTKKMVRQQILQAREMKSEPDQKKLTFNITYYLVFQNVRNIL